MAAFSDLNANSSQLYTSPLSSLSAPSTDSISKILGVNQNSKDKLINPSTSLNSLYSYSDDDYRQCRRVRNIAIAHQQSINDNRYASNHDDSRSTSTRTNERNAPRLSRFWRTVRSLQLGFRHRNQTGNYVEQINNSDPVQRRTVTGTSLQTIEEDEAATFQRADLAMAAPALNELPATTPVVPPLTVISLSSSDQDDEQEAVTVTGQTLRELFAKRF